MSVKGAIGFTITKIGCWWGTNPKLKREEEIDIVGVNPLAKYVLLGECKYQNQGIHLDTAKKLLETPASEIFLGSAAEAAKAISLLQENGVSFSVQPDWPY